MFFLGTKREEARKSHGENATILKFFYLDMDLQLMIRSSISYYYWLKAKAMQFLRSNGCEFLISNNCVLTSSNNGI